MNLNFEDDFDILDNHLTGCTYKLKGVGATYSSLGPIDVILDDNEWKDASGAYVTNSATVYTKLSSVPGGAKKGDQIIIPSIGLTVNVVSYHFNYVSGQVDIQVIKVRT